MATLKELIYNIRNISKGGVVVTDTLPSYKQVKFWINYYRALLIKRDLDKKKTINPDVVQDLGCIPVISVDPSECCNATVNTGCVMLRTTAKIPTTIELNFSNALLFVGLIDKVTAFPLTSVIRSKWNKYNKFTSGLSEAFLLNEYVYVTHATELEYINIRGIFEDPTAAAEFSQCPGQPCYTDNSEYPVASWMIPLITELILTKELRITLALPQDVVNDAKDNKPVQEQKL